jgi:putative glutamine amidotransferase
MPRRPSIGITSYWAHAAMSHWATDAVLVSQGYVEGVRLAGGRPLVLPADPLWATQPDDVLDLLDGLVVIGGDDIAAERFGAEHHPASGPPHQRRDESEIGLLTRALERDLPVLGICRGMQLLNVVRGGTLDQHLPDSIEITPHRADDRTMGTHDVVTVPGTLAARVAGARQTVRSHHHQGVARVGEGLIVSATAADGIVEAIEDPALRFCLGVLWHPDADPRGTGAAAFAALVAAATALSSTPA